MLDDVLLEVQERQMDLKERQAVVDLVHEFAALMRLEIRFYSLLLDGVSDRTLLERFMEQET